MKRDWGRIDRITAQLRAGDVPSNEELDYLARNVDAHGGIDRDRWLAARVPVEPPEPTIAERAAAALQRAMAKMNGDLTRFSPAAEVERGGSGAGAGEAAAAIDRAR